MNTKKLSDYLSKMQDFCNNMDTQKTTPIIISDSKGNYLERETKRPDANEIEKSVV